MVFAGAGNGGSGRGSAGFSTFQRRTPSPPAAASSRPLGSTSSRSIGPAPASIGTASRRGRDGSETSHTVMVDFMSPIASVRESGVRASA
ncbi:hypothetical protein [Lentzea flava]|uniref:hypothetical protein n=1 Tax=Lentzea flava TaxID=103732 RepID=UPI0016716D64|nr:hypothetical protein [Lentzea flava]